MKNLTYFLSFVSILFLSACGSDDDTTNPIEDGTATYEYNFHNGQVVATAPYAGSHNSDFSATMLLEEMDNGNTMITVTLNNTIEGEVYNMHAHDAADATTTPNGTPYNETPNGEIFAQMATGDGGSVSVSQEATVAFDSLITNYAGFFVVHDPLQAVNTADITTFLTVGGFARAQSDATFESTTFDYAFNTGQLNEAFAYVGTHDTSFSAEVTVDELAEDQSRITVRFNNTMDLITYNVHVHDAADATTTPNGTPYNETPNSEIYAGTVVGNGGTVARTQISSMSYTALTTTYDGFFVVHDPIVTVNTADPTTFIAVGVFAR